jgi:hypothetical protein
MFWTKFGYVGFEVSTAVVMKSIIFWDMMPCSLLSCNRRFGGTYRLHLLCRRNNSASKQTTRRNIPEDDTLQNLVNFSRAQLASLSQIPVSDQEICGVRGTKILVYTPLKEVKLKLYKNNTYFVSFWGC